MPKTIQDLKLQYKKETGQYPIELDKIEGKGDDDNWALVDLINYIEWLEQVAITHLK